MSQSPQTTTCSRNLLRKIRPILLQGEAAEVTQSVGHDLSSKHHMPISDIDGDFENALKYARSSEYALHEPKLQTVSYRIHWYVSWMTEPPDFHPHSLGKLVSFNSVQDLIDPILWYSKGSSTSFREDHAHERGVNTTSKLHRQDAQKREENAEKMKEDIRRRGNKASTSLEMNLWRLRYTKATNYTLSPGRKYEGSWHMESVALLSEGSFKLYVHQPHERIVASVIYYYETDDIIALWG
ncbi:hypothetical protein C8R42DRAFT_645547 [Lentinula raphanica]|nr:hypothetical protein C8R42DRAFT_645547 [Lentinula raphanica]